MVCGKHIQQYLPHGGVILVEIAVISLIHPVCSDTGGKNSILRFRQRGELVANESGEFRIRCFQNEEVFNAGLHRYAAANAVDMRDSFFYIAADEGVLMRLAV